MTLHLYSQHLFSFFFLCCPSSQALVLNIVPKGPLHIQLILGFFQAGNLTLVFLTLYFSELLAVSPGSQKGWWLCWYWTWPVDFYIHVSPTGACILLGPLAESQCMWGVEWGWQWRLVLLKDFKENLFIYLASLMACELLVPWPGIKPSPQQWKLWEFPKENLNFITINPNTLCRGTQSIHEL